MFKKVDNILDYVEKLLLDDCDIIWAYKKGLVIARKAQEGERVITYASDGGIETINIAKKGDVILTKADADGNAIIDVYGHDNTWVISEGKFKWKYDTKHPVHENVYKSKVCEQQFIKVSGDIKFEAPWKKMEYLESGGYLNISCLADTYGVSEKDFNDTYTIIKKGEINA